MRKVCEIAFTFDGLASAEFDAITPCISRTLDDLLRGAPSFARCLHHGIYNYKCSLGSFNTIRIQKSGLFIIMHDGKCFDSHPLIAYLKSELISLFPDAQFTWSSS